MRKFGVVLNVPVLVKMNALAVTPVKIHLKQDNSNYLVISAKPSTV